MDSVEQRCIELIAGAKNIALDTVHPQSTFEQLDMDSLDKINLSFAVEESFGIEIPDAEIWIVKKSRAAAEELGAAFVEFSAHDGDTGLDPDGLPSLDPAAPDGGRDLRSGAEEVEPRHPTPGIGRHYQRSRCRCHVVDQCRRVRAPKGRIPPVDLLDVGLHLDALGPQVGHRRLQVVAHQ